jgi:hypothetical protein
MFNSSTQYIFANRYRLYKDAAGRRRAISKLKKRYTNNLQSASATTFSGENDKIALFY